MKKIAVILPQPFTGNYLRTAKDLALMLHGAERSEPIEVVFGYTPGEIDAHSDLDELTGQGIACREISFKIIPHADAKAILHLAQVKKELRHDQYLLPSDGANDFYDCDAWLIVSDKISLPVLPLRPLGFFIFDCAARYVPQLLLADFEGGVVPGLRGAEFVIATSPSILADLNSFVGVARNKLHLMPMFFQTPELTADASAPFSEPYFVWSTTASPEGNHARVIKALQRYYGELGGSLRAVMVGPATDSFRLRQKGAKPGPFPDYAAEIRTQIEQTPRVSRELTIAGELSATQQTTLIKHAKFVLHAGLVNQGPAAIIEAACLGVPAICSRNPTTEYMNDRFDLSADFFDAYSVRELAAGLKRLEEMHSLASASPTEIIEKCSPRAAAPALRKIVTPHLGMLNACN